LVGFDPSKVDGGSDNNNRILIAVLKKCGFEKSKI
jgi:hypothetical protein